MVLNLGRKPKQDWYSNICRYCFFCVPSRLLLGPCSLEHLLSFPPTQ